MMHWIGLWLLGLSMTIGAAKGSPGGIDEAALQLPSFALQGELGPITEDKLFESSTVALQVVNVSTGEEVYSFGGDISLTPASVMKVLTSATALKTMGGSHRFKTGFYRDGEVSSEGVLEGDLYVRGTGDPTFVVEKLWKLIYDLRIAGIQEVKGDVVFDAGYFDDRSLIEGWRKDVDMEQGPAYFAPTGALSLNYNTLCIVVSTGSEIGEPAKVRLEVPYADIRFDNQVETVSASSRGWTRIEREIDDQSGEVVYHLEGRVPLGDEPTRHYRAVQDPLAFFMSSTGALLADGGIEIEGELRIGSLPADSDLIVERVSPPLSEILNHTNKYSSNFMAEQVLKAIGAEADGAPGTTASGVRVVTEYLESIGIPRAEFVLVNGSGLSRAIYVRPSHINAVLVDMFQDDLNAPEFLASMSISGVDGTLRKRFSEEDLAGRVRGKTGSLNGVACLAGYFRAEDGEVYSLTILSNGVRRSSPMRALHDKLGEALLAVDAVPVEVDLESARITPAP